MANLTRLLLCMVWTYLTGAASHLTSHLASSLLLFSHSSSSSSCQCLFSFSFFLSFSAYCLSLPLVFVQSSSVSLIDERASRVSFHVESIPATVTVTDGSFTHSQVDSFTLYNNTLQNLGSQKTFAAYRKKNWNTQTKENIFIQGAWTHLSGATLESSFLLYSLIRSDVQITGTFSTHESALQQLRNNEVDFAISSHLYSEDEARATPDLIKVPLLAHGCAIVANIPSVRAANLLTIDTLTVCQVLTGNITHWQHERIQALNSKISLPNEPIQLGLMTVENPCFLSLSQACLKIWPEWVDYFGERPQSIARWPLHRYERWTMDQDIVTPITRANDHQAYLSFGEIHTCVTLRAPTVAIINPAGLRILPTTAAIQYAVYELLLTSGGSSDSPLDEVNDDLTLSTGPHAWPFCVLVNLYVPKAMTRKSCRQKSELVKFWGWFYASDMVASSSQAAYVSLIPKQLQDHLNLLTLVKSFTCEDEPINSGKLLSLQGVGPDASHVGSDVFGTLLLAYQQSQPLYQFDFSLTSATDALSSYLANSLDAALISLHPEIVQVSDSVLLDKVTNPVDGSMSLIPVTVYHLAPVMHLPELIASRRQEDYTKTVHSNTHPPFFLNMETLALVWLGEITHFTHPLIEADNPGLTDLFVQLSEQHVDLSLPPVSSSIELVFARTIPHMDQPLTNAFFQTLYRTKTFQARVKSGDIPVESYPLNMTFWLNRYQNKHMKYKLVNLETQLLPTALSDLTQGSISYRILNTLEADDAIDIKLLYTTSSGTSSNRQTTDPSDSDSAAGPVTLTLENTVLNSYHCLNSLPIPALTNSEGTKLVHLNYNEYSNREENIRLHKCWPFVLYSALALPKQYHSAPCLKGQVTAGFLNFFLRNQNLKSHLDSDGFIMLSYVPHLIDYLTSIFSQIKCDGESILFHSPSIWSLSREISTIGFALIAVGLSVCTLHWYGLFKYASHPIIRSASLPFQCFTLSGISLFFTSLCFLLLRATSTTCNLFIWTIFVAFALSFSPLFMKMYRIYLIFHRSKELKVLQLNNKFLSLCVLALVAVECLLLSIVQVFAPAVVATSTVTTNTMVGITVANNGMTQPAMETIQYSACSFNYDKQAFPYIFILLVYNTALVCFGVYISIVTRHVASQYNESKNIALSLYNLLLSVITIVGIVYLLKLQGDSLILAMLIVVFTIPTATLLLTQTSKFILIYQNRESLARRRRQAQQRQLLHGASGTSDSRVSTSSSSSGDVGGVCAESGSSLDAQSLPKDQPFLFDMEERQEFVFPSLSDIQSVHTLDGYISNLERQIKQAKRRWLLESSKVGGYHQQVYAQPPSTQSNTLTTVNEDDEGISHFIKLAVTPNGSGTSGANSRIRNDKGNTIVPDSRQIHQAPFKSSASPPGMERQTRTTTRGIPPNPHHKPTPSRSAHNLSAPNQLNDNSTSLVLTHSNQPKESFTQQTGSLDNTPPRRLLPRSTPHLQVSPSQPYNVRGLNKIVEDSSSPKFAHNPTGKSLYVSTSFSASSTTISTTLPRSTSVSDVLVPLSHSSRLSSPSARTHQHPHLAHATSSTSLVATSQPSFSYSTVGRLPVRSPSSSSSTRDSPVGSRLLNQSSASVHVSTQATSEVGRVPPADEPERKERNNRTNRQFQDESSTYQVFRFVESDAAISKVIHDLTPGREQLEHDVAPSPSPSPSLSSNTRQMSSSHANRLEQIQYRPRTHQRSSSSAQSSQMMTVASHPTPSTPPPPSNLRHNAYTASLTNPNTPTMVKQRSSLSPVQIRLPDGNEV